MSLKLAISGKGGVGKSTLSGTLARLFAVDGRKVLAIDADPDANLASALGAAKRLERAQSHDYCRCCRENTAANRRCSDQDTERSLPGVGVDAVRRRASSQDPVASAATLGNTTPSDRPSKPA